MKQYQKITTDILSSINISEQDILNKYIQSSYFRDAFVHKSHNPIHNYEYLELKGDCVVNLAIAQYIKKRFPLIKSQKWLTKIYHNLRSTKYLSNLSKELNFDKCILYDKDEKIDTNSVLEDCFESFFGALVNVTDEWNNRGVGYSISYSIISNLYDKYDLPLNFDEYFENKPRVKELFDMMKWNFKNEKIRFDPRQKKYLATLEIYPKGDKTVKPENSIEVEGFSYKSGEEASYYLYRSVLGLLKKYGIEEKIFDPYIIDVKVENLKPYILKDILPEDFKDKIKLVLKKCLLTDDLVDKFSKNEYLIEFRKCFIDESYDPYNNINTYHFEGSPIIEYVVVDYISKKLHHDENLITHAKHKIIGSKSNLFYNIYNEFDFKKYLLMTLPPEIDTDVIKNSILYQKTINSSFKSLIGCLVNILDKNIFTGVGYAAVYNFMNEYLNKIKLSQDISEVTSYKSQLKEYYDKKPNLGNLGDNIIHSFDEENKTHKIKIRYGNKIISEAELKNKTDAVEQASKIALQKLGVLKK